MTESSTVTALVNAAEQHFATVGFDKASLRAMMRDAGADPGAVHYHFGGRPELAAAVLDRLLAPINARRLELLDELVALDADPLSATTLVDALVRPDVEAAARLNERQPGRARIIGAIYINPAAFVTAQVDRHFNPVAQRFHPHLANAAPHVPGDVLAWRVRWCLFGMIGAVMSAPFQPTAMSPEDLVQRLVPAAAAALTAPVHNQEPTE